MDAESLAQKPSGYIDGAKIHHELPLNIDITSVCLWDRTREVKELSWIYYCFVPVLWFRDLVLAPGAGHWVRWFTLCGTYFLLPLYSLIPVNLLAFVLCLIALGSIILDPENDVRLPQLQLHQKDKATCRQWNYWQACHWLPGES